ncbi:MAG: hypothetical protein WKF79_15855 [Nocardioides sp.]
MAEKVVKTERVHTDRSASVNRARTNLARVVWLIFLVFALVLAGAALLITLEANPENDLVKFLLNFADRIDLGIFNLEDPIKEFDGKNAETKTALLNYGIGAIVYLIIGRVAERLIRP